MKTKTKGPTIAQITAPIKASLTKHINSTTTNPKLSQWYCGITNDTTRRNAEHRTKKGLIKHFFALDAQTFTKAREVEKYFTDKGTSNDKRKGNTVKNTTNVYVFKLPPTTLGNLAKFDVEAYLNGF